MLSPSEIAALTRVRDGALGDRLDLEPDPDQRLLTERGAIVPDFDTGIVLDGCGQYERTVVAYRTGIALVIAGEIRLCHECGPYGGVYHPANRNTLAAVKALAELIA